MRQVIAASHCSEPLQQPSRASWEPRIAVRPWPQSPTGFEENDPVMEVRASQEFVAVDQEVVLDLSSPYVILGTLCAHDDHYLVLENVDLHDLRDSNTTREIYVRTAKQFGINPNRKRIYVQRREVVSLSVLADVLE